MTKVIKEESKKLELVEIDEDLFTYDTRLGMIFNEYNILNIINDDLFTCEIEVPKPTPCVKQRTGDSTHNDLGEYEWKMSYEECKKIYVEADGKAKWPTYNSNEDGFCNGGELPGMVRVGYMTYFQDYEGNVHNEEEQEDEERHKLFQEPPICKIRSFEMIKYSFGQEEEYFAIKKNKYDDLTRTNEDACHAYQEIFRNMDEGWLVTRAE
ncbi:hypothetical protein Tco_1177252 [Tanacetum coccineum]